MSNLILARPYAKAAFEMAQKEKAFSKWSDMLELAENIGKDKIVAQLMKDPKFPQEEVLVLFLSVGKDVFNQEMQSFLKILSRFKRLKVLPEIAALYNEMRANEEKVVAVELICAQPISESFEQRFKQALKERLNRDITLESKTDKSLLGGAIIRAGDLLLTVQSVADSLN